MPQQLIYTSAPRGLVAGRSGYCTVARTVSMREALMLQLERFSYYQHLSLNGGQERPIFAYRIVDIRGSRFHVLSRIQDAGLDFTGRTNFIAHHLVFTPEEVRQNATPPVIFCEWTGWITSWPKEPQMLEDKNWPELATLVGRSNIPAQTWQRLSGNAANGYGLLEARAGVSFRVDGMADDDILKLFAESLELLEARDARRDFRGAAWNYTFTTSMQEQDNPADFRWRCIRSDNPIASRFATPDCPALSAVRATRVTDEEAAFARIGRQKPRVVVEPKEIRITEGETARFTARADGVPSPTCQWFSVDRNDTGHGLPGETNSELIVSNPVLGISRYVVSASNSAGDAQSNVATLIVNQKAKLGVKGDASSQGPAKTVLYNEGYQEKKERQLKRIEAEKAQKILQQRKLRNKILAVTGLLIVVLSITGIIFKDKFMHKIAHKTAISSEATNAMTNNVDHKLVATSTTLSNSLPAKTGSPSNANNLKDQNVSNDWAKANSKKTGSTASKNP